MRIYIYIYLELSIYQLKPDECVLRGLCVLEFNTVFGGLHARFVSNTRHSVRLFDLILDQLTPRILIILFKKGVAMSNHSSLVFKVFDF